MPSFIKTNCLLNQLLIDDIKMQDELLGFNKPFSLVYLNHPLTKLEIFAN